MESSIKIKTDTLTNLILEPIDKPAFYTAGL